MWSSHPINPISIPPPNPTLLPQYTTSYTSTASTLVQVAWTTAAVSWWVSLLPLLSPWCICPHCLKPSRRCSLPGRKQDDNRPCLAFPSQLTFTDLLVLVLQPFWSSPVFSLPGNLLPSSVLPIHPPDHYAKTVSSRKASLIWQSRSELLKVQSSAQCQSTSCSQGDKCRNLEGSI